MAVCTECSLSRLHYRSQPKLLMYKKGLKHTEIRKRAFQVKDSMPDELFFSNPGLFTYLEASLRALLGDNPRKIRLKAFYDPLNSSVAYTDNKTVYINTGNCVTSSLPTRPKKYLSILGLILHEVGHIYYTDFPANSSYMQSVQEGEWYPSTPDGGTAIQLELKSNELLKKLFGYIAHNLMNRVEDAYIELRVTQRFHGLYEQGLIILNQATYEKSHTLSELFAALKEGKLHMLDIFLESILLYAKGQDIKNSAQAKKDYPDEFSEYISVFSKIKPIVRKLRTERSAMVRWSYVNTIMVILWDYIKDRAENISEDSELLDSSEYDIAADVCEAIIRKLSETLSEDKCGAVPIGSTRPLGEKGLDKPKSDDGATDTPPVSEETSSEALRELEKLSESIATSVLEEELSEELSKEISEFGPKRYKDLVKEVEKLKEMRKRPSLSDSDIEELSARIAYKASQAKCAGNVQYYLNRETTVSVEQINDYNNIMSEMKPLSKALQRKVNPILKERNYEGKISGLPMGKRLSSRLIYRDDGKIFSKPLVPDGNPQIAIGVLIDESGSMYGQKISKARQTSILVEDFLRNVQIPHIIIGHTADQQSCPPKYSVDLTSYVEFNSYDESDKYRLAKVQAQANNRDGAALAYIYERLLQRPENRKLLLVITDGEPAARNYSGHPAIIDSKVTVDEYNRKGIKTIALAIDGTISNIKQIYGEDKLIVVDNLSDLPNILTGILKRQILK